MKLFRQKNLVQKIIITSVIVILFNFIIPGFCNATGSTTNKEDTKHEFGGVLFSPIQDFVLSLGDSAMWLFSKLMGIERR